MRVAQSPPPPYRGGGPLWGGGVESVRGGTPPYRFGTYLLLVDARRAVHDPPVPRGGAVLGEVHEARLDEVEGQGEDGARPPRHGRGNHRGLQRGCLVVVLL